MSIASVIRGLALYGLSLTKNSIGNADGSAAAPSYTFYGQRNTGFYRNGASDLRVSVNGVDVMRWNLSQVIIPSTSQLAWGSSGVGGVDITFARTAAATLTMTGNLVISGALGDKSYSLQVPTTGFSITIPNNISTLILDPAGTLATGTITMTAAPFDGQIVTVSSSQIITGLTMSANSGQSIKDAPTTFAAGARVQYIYSLSNTTWYIH